MKFKHYLNEGRSVSIDKEAAIGYIKTNCKKNYNFFMKKKDWIFRGVDSISSEYIIIDTNKGRPRVSANTQNYFTLLMDNLPSWKKYPKRSHSIICATDQENAKSYGTLYVVIPYDNTNIGIAPDGDIWWSFKETHILDFNDTISKMFRKYKLPARNWKELKSSLIELNKGNIIRQGGFGVFDRNKDIIKEMDYIYSPEYNNFKHGLKNMSYGKEIWIQGKSIMIDERIFWGIMDEI